jgi:hypothetical protein
MESGFQKTGWHWTRKGWKRTPKHLLAVKKVRLPSKRKTRKKAGITPATPTEKPADSAPVPAPEAEKPATRPPRTAWSGKYDDLTKPTEGEP